MTLKYISNRPETKYKLHRLCSLCGRTIVVHLDPDRNILSKHAYFVSPLPQDRDEGIWECADCLRGEEDKEWRVYDKGAQEGQEVSVQR